MENVQQAAADYTHVPPAATREESALTTLATRYIGALNSSDHPINAGKPVGDSDKCSIAGRSALAPLSESFSNLPTMQSRQVTRSV